MLTTQELTTEIRTRYGPEWKREAIVSFIKRAQNDLCLLDNREMVWWNGADISFPVPLLKTTAEQLVYTVGDDGSGDTGLADSEGNDIASIEITRSGVSYPVTPRAVRDVFTRRRGTPFVFTPYMYSWLYDDLAALGYTSVEWIPDEADTCKIGLMEDPGTSTNEFYVLFYHNPIDLASDAIPLTINGDKWHQALIDGAVGYIEDIENGKSARLDKFEKTWKKRFSGFGARQLRHYRSPSMPIREVG